MMSFLFLFCVSIFSWSQEGVPASTSGEDLQKSFQREYVYLSSQKEALSKQKSNMSSRFKERISLSKQAVQNEQREIVRLSGLNDEKHEYMMNLEKRKKELQRKGSSLENTYKKAQSTIRDFEAGLHFESLAKKTEVATKEDLQIEDFDQLITKSQDLLLSSSQVETYPGAFLDLKGELVEGTITRIGRSAAIGSVKSGSFVLGPNGEGLLKALEVSRPISESSLNLYIFESLHKVAKIKRTAGWSEKLADLSPLLFLTMILLLVGGLFSALIKV